jgi:bifunctional DNase/RNase
LKAGYLRGEEAVMTSLTDTDFVPMRLGKVVAVSTEDGPSFCVVLEGVTRDTRLPISIGDTEGFNLSATLTGVQFGRPMSPQFAAELLHALGGHIRQVRIDRLVEVHGGTAYGSTVEVEGPTGVTLVDARPSDALNLVALVPAPILVARVILADAQARLEGDSPEGSLLRRAMEAEQTTIQRQPSDP